MGEFKEEETNKTGDGENQITDRSIESEHMAMIKGRKIVAETIQRETNLTNEEGNDQIKAKPMTPMTPLQASATIVNLVLATGPFTYPQGFVALGPVLSLTLLAITTVVAYITATFMIEAISVANAEDTKRRTFSMFGAQAYKSPIVQRKQNLKDQDNKSSPFYIRQKIEIGIIAERLAPEWVKTLIIIILVVYMYGAICLKFVSGAESFDAGIAYTFWGREDGL